MNTLQGNLENVERIEDELHRIDSAIAALKTERAAVLRSDEEYAGYLDDYEAYYDDEPLSIRSYYMCAARLDMLNKQAMKEIIETGDISGDLMKQIVIYERKLAA